MRNLGKVFLFIVAVFAISCESEEKKVETLKTETIAIHDEVMPKMDDIMKLKKSLKDRKENISEEKQETVQGLIIALEESDKAMMNWMRNYDPRMEGLTNEEKLEYLQSKKASISEVSEKMKKSISDAEEFLK